MLTFVIFQKHVEVNVVHRTDQTHHAFHRGSTALAPSGTSKEVVGIEVSMTSLSLFTSANGTRAHGYTFFATDTLR